MLLISISIIVSTYMRLAAEYRAKTIAIAYANGISKVIDSSLEYYMQKGDKKEIANLINQLSKNKDILSINIFDNSKKLAPFNPNENFKKFRDENLEKIIAEMEYIKNYKVIKTNNKSFLAYFSPYENKNSCRGCHNEKGLIGTLNINIDMKEIHSSIISQANKTLIVLFASSIFIAILLSFLIKILVTKPLRTIEKAMTEVVHNNLDVRVNINSGDEFEKLGNDFNNMVKSLENANKSIDNMHKRIIHSDRLMTIGKLAASISHEIKNPLNSIMITSDILLEYCKKINENDKLKKLLESIIEDAQRIRGIIDQTLNFSRYETEKNEIIKVRETTKIISIYAKRILFHKTNIIFITSDELTEDISIKGNKTNIEQMLINILKNSVESIPDNKRGKIDMQLSNDDKFVKFKISDNGIGISKEKLELIFEEFYSTKTNGTGLGLSIVKEIVENHNGKIEIESEENKGTVVTIKLPIYRG